MSDALKGSLVVSHECDTAVAHRASEAGNSESPFITRSGNPFVEATDALAAHGRQQRGRVFKHLLTDADLAAANPRLRAEQIEAMREGGRRGGARPKKAVRGADGRFLKS